MRFLGHVERAAVPEVITRARAVVQPSESPENAPFSVLEAMALGTPVIVSDMGGLPELAEKASGKVFAAGDAAALARCIRQVWDDPDGAAAMAESGRRAVADDFSVATHLDKLEDIYRRACSGER